MPASAKAGHGLSVRACDLVRTPGGRASTGPRRTDGTSADLDVGFSYPFETGGSAHARIRGRRSAIASDTAAADARRGALENPQLWRSSIRHTPEQRVQLLSDVEQTAAEPPHRHAAVRGWGYCRPGRSTSRSRHWRGLVPVGWLQNSDRSLAAARLARVGWTACGWLSQPMRSWMPTAPSTCPAFGRAAAAAPDPDRAAGAHRGVALATVRLGRGVRRPDIGLGLQGEARSGEHGPGRWFHGHAPHVGGKRSGRAGHRQRRGCSRARRTGDPRKPALCATSSRCTAYVMRREAAGARTGGAPGAIESEQLGSNAALKRWGVESPRPSRCAARRHGDTSNISSDCAMPPRRP